MLNTVLRTMSKIAVVKLDAGIFPKKNLAVVLHGKNDLRLEEWPLPEKLNPYGKRSINTIQY